MGFVPEGIDRYFAMSKSVRSRTIVRLLIR